MTRQQPAPKCKVLNPSERKDMNTKHTRNARAEKSLSDCILHEGSWSPRCWMEQWAKSCLPIKIGDVVIYFAGNKMRKIEGSFTLDAPDEAVERCRGIIRRRVKMWCDYGARVKNGYPPITIHVIQLSKVAISYSEENKTT